MSSLVLAFLTMAATQMPAKVVLTDLQCEYQSQPLAIESPHPRLSWISETDARNWSQSARQILVASSPDLLAKGNGDLWDSGKVESKESIQIPYQGSFLASRQKCFWKVRVWDQTGVPSAWSAAQKWEMGLLNLTDWEPSEWIGGRRTGASPEPAPYLRKEFSISGEVKAARLYVCGLGYAEISLNGKDLAPDTEREPGYTNFDKRVLYVVHDVTRQVRQGQNCLGAILGTGWYDTHDKATWNFDEAPWRDRPKLRLVLELEMADGQTQKIVSDESWQTSDGPIRFDGIYTGEVYDARKELGDWNKPGFDASAWTRATLAKPPKGSLIARKCGPVVVSQTIKPVSLAEPKPGVFILDLGQNFSGHVRLKVKGPAGTKIKMRYSERLDDKGMIDLAEIAKFMDRQNPPQPFQTDEYICKGEGEEVWEQRFSYSGFRYVEVTGFPGRPALKNFEGRFAHTTFETAGEFECSNPLLNSIQDATRRAYYSNAQNIPTDCPQREKNGWTGDAHLASEAGLMNFGSAAFYTKWLDDFKDAQNSEGGVPVIIPSGGWSFNGCHPVWDSAYAVIANEMADYLGDTRILKESSETLRRYVDFLYAKTEKEVIPFDSLGDWLPWKTETSSQLIATVMLAEDARILAKAERLSGNEDSAKKYQEMSDRINKAAWKAFYDPSKLNDASQTALALALRFPVAPKDQRAAVLAALVANVERQRHIDAGIVGAKHVLRILSENGRTDLAYRIVARKEQPGWGWWIEQGATTLWEDWKGESSLNHIMFGDVSNWFIQWLAGIGLDRKECAFRHISFQPQIVGDLTWAKARHKSPYGWISSEWKVTGRRVRVKILVPANCTGTLTMPYSGIKHEVGSGSYEFSESGE